MGQSVGSRYALSLLELGRSLTNRDGCDSRVAVGDKTRRDEIGRVVEAMGRQSGWCWRERDETSGILIWNPSLAV